MQKVKDILPHHPIQKAVVVYHKTHDEFIITRDRLTFNIIADTRAFFRRYLKRLTGEVKE